MRRRRDIGDFPKAGVAVVVTLLASLHLLSAGAAHAQSSCSGPFLSGTNGPSTYVIEGCVWHHGGCSVEYGTMTLSPLDRSAQVERSYFCFDGIPPGEYRLSYSPQCNPAGCTGVQRVSVVDEDVYVVIGRSNCPGDCNADRKVNVQEVIRCVAQVLGEGSGCRLCDANGDYQVGVADLVVVVGSLLHGC